MPTVVVGAIKTFDAMAENGGVKIESMDIDVDLPIQFPTHEDVVIGACTCGEDCECSGCATHGIPPRTGTGGTRRLLFASLLSTVDDRIFSASAALLAAALVCIVMNEAFNL